MARIGQLLLLTWKNFKLQFRHPWVTLLELGVPAFFSLILVLIRSVISSEYVTKPVYYDPFSINSLPSNLTPSGFKQWEILYVPETEFTNYTMSRVAFNLNAKETGFSSEESMIEYYNNHTSTILSGIIFESELDNNTFSTDNIRVTIRPKAAEGGNSAIKNTLSNWFTEYTFPMFPALGPRNRDSGYGGSPGYMSQGFLPVQHSIAMSAIQYILSNIKKEEENINISVDMSRYPYPPYIDDKFIVALQLFFPMIICFSFIYPAVNIVKNLVIEKEKRIKEAMKMMGLSRWLHWTAWFIKYFIFLCISCGIMTLLLCVKFDQNIAVINSSDPSVILMWLVLYTVNTISFCFLISTLFSKANSSAAGSGVIFFLTFVPYFFILPRYNDLSHAEKMIACLLPNIAIALGSVVLTVSEAAGKGLQWDNLKIPATPDDTLTMSSIFIMFIVGSLICFAVTWYVEAVFPGEYGVPEPWYFPFTRSYWCGAYTNFSDMIQFYDSNVKKSEFFERDPDLMKGIQIQGLTKVFNKGIKPAVNNMNINMYRGHITVLLGHNGAGKTTTISMLTGLITPTSGTALVNGHDICDDMDSVHSSLGICPQHDILFDELTVKEHLYFFCKLKDYISDMVPSEIVRIMTSLGLLEKCDAKAATLSGGWKRKLSVGIALVGGSRIVILDEPTSGMDPYNRRSLWDVLQTEKEDRTILLTTHFMEEADVLGDRIAIMANGEIQCCGSPLFLKKKYGAGYHLVMVKEYGCDVNIITQVIQAYVPSAEMASNIGSELKYILPHESSSSFFSLFSELENRRNELKISGYGASITTMEEVFIKVGNDAALHDSIELEVQKETISACDSGINFSSEYNDNFSGTDVDLESVESEPERRNFGFHLFGQQLYALLEKRVLHSYRNSLLTCSQLILSPFFLILTLLMLKTLPKPQDSPPLVLDVKSYHGTEVPFIVDLSSNMSMDLGQVYSSLFSGEDKPHILYKNKDRMTSYLVKEAREDLSKYNMHNMIAASFLPKSQTNETKIIAYFNNQAFHSPAISLLQVDNTILKYLVHGNYSFSVTNHPLPRTLAEKGKQQQTQTTESYQIAQDIMFGMSFLVASFAVFIIKERSSNSKHLQRVSGVNLFSYWLASFLWDFLNYLIPCCLVLLIFFCFKTEGLSSPTELGRLFLLFFIHGFAALPFVYCCTFLFLSPSTAYVRLSLFNILLGIACLLTITILEIPDLGVEYVAKPLDDAFSLLIPNYSLGRAVSNLYQNYQFNKFCTLPGVDIVCTMGFGPFFDIVKPCCKGKCGSMCIPWEKNFLSVSSPGIGKQLIFFAIQSVVFSLLLVLCEKNFLRYLRYKFKNYKVSPSHISSVDESIENDNAVEDDDVRAERLRILNSPASELFLTNHLVIKELTKNYGTFRAVNRLTFGVQKGECFGLLGLNGAGKTTTFKMITGDESISSGEVYLSGFSIKSDMRKVQSRIGYCPQFDALIDQLTGSETLTMFARLRGIPEQEIPNQVTSLGELLGFESHMHKQVKDYSGGNKRKLSTAISLIGKPPVVFLDEPTTGMDPVSRRYMWKALLQVIQSGCSIVLTSHSMEECEALCSRLVIMVNGRLCCLGSSQHLKNKFAQGFTLIVKVRRRPSEQVFQMRSTVQDGASGPLYVPQGWMALNNTLVNDIDDVKAFVERTFVSATLKTASENILHYHIPNPQLNWSEIFRAMEEAKLSLNIEDYSVGETTLEQVFLNFAMVQRDSDVLT